jgi:hypothetical protein
MKTPALARVTLTLEIPISSTWGDKCEVGQVRQQATEEALGKIARFAEKNQFRAKVIGTPKVTMIFVDPEGAS